VSILSHDLRFGWRQLRKRPAFTALAIISMALGIGANSAIFSLVDTVLLRPLPVRAPNQLFQIYGTQHKDADITLQSYLNYKDYRDRNTVLSGLITYRVAVASLSERSQNERIWGYLVSGNYFDVLGVQPILGRGFRAEEDKTPEASPVAILSYTCWQKRFGSDRSIIGRAVSINHKSFTVIGVAPKGFIGTEVAFAPQFWIPLTMAKSIEIGSNWLERRDTDNLFMVGRLKDGVSAAQAEASLQTLTAQLVQEYPKENGGRGLRLARPGLFIPQIRDPVFALSGVLTAVGGLVLLLACVNLANLLLARATERRKEIAVRLAVGASRRRLVRQLVTESVLLSLLGGALGMGLALGINHFIASIKLPFDFALLFDLRVDWRVLVFTLVISLFTGIAFSLIPALQSSKPELVPALKEEGALAGFRRSRLRNALVVAQVALSLVLLISAGLIVRGLQAAQNMRPGFNPESAVAFSFDVALQGYDEPNGRAFYPQVLDRMRAVPGVKSAALVSSLPLSVNYSSSSIYIEGEPVRGSSDLPNAVPMSVSPGYFETMEVPMRGRDFLPNENKLENRVAIVNETFAHKFFPGQDPTGKRFNSQGPDQPYWQIIGVCGDGKYNSLGEAPQAAYYRPEFRDYDTPVTLVARVTGHPRAVLSALQHEMRQLDPALPLFEVKTLREHMGIPLFPARVAAGALGSFGILALVLGAVGIYGVMSYVVAGRVREIGLRMALGAQSRDVRRLILRQGMLLAVLGSAIGLAVAFGVTRLLTSLLYGVSAYDFSTFASVTLLLGAVAVLACLLPANRATRVDPMKALRAE
jgi:macrolide transport system ATP-binding/permease protein